MCERILSLLFRLYPSGFRERYLREVLLLYRDRWGCETGPYRSFRLTLDLLVDFVAGLPRAWQTSYSSTTMQTQLPDIHSAPSFRLLTVEPLRPTSILLGGALSVTAIGIFVLLMRTTTLLSSERDTPSPVYSVLQHLNQPSSPSPEKDPPNKKTGTTPASTPIPNQVQLQSANDNSQRNTQFRILPIQADSPKMAKAGEEPARSRLGSKASADIAARDLKTSKPAALAASIRSAATAPGGQAHPQDATAAMIQAISSHQVVMFGETHGNKQEYEWLCQLVRDPRFAEQTDDIVVEFGNSLYQKTVDRYIAGENVPLAQVQKGWRNVIGAVGPVSPVYGELYKAIRESNLERRDGHKIRLLLGDPYGDWDKINNAEDLGPYLGHREQWYAQVVKDEVLAHHHRALLIMGAGHFARRSGPGIVEQSIRTAGVQPYLVVFGTNAVNSYDDIDPRLDAWSLPAIVPLPGTWVGELPANPVLTGGVVAPNSQKMEDVADAMLYVGPRDKLTQLFVPRSELVDTGYGKEIERRLQIQTGHTMQFDELTEGPQYRKPPQQIVSNGIQQLPPNAPKSSNDPLPPRPLSQ